MGEGRLTGRANRGRDLSGASPETSQNARGRSLGSISRPPSVDAPPRDRSARKRSSITAPRSSTQPCQLAGRLPRAEYFSDPPSPPPPAPAPNSSKVEKLSAAVTVGTAAALANPLVAEAAVTPSLKNTLLSVVAGGLVLGAIAAAVIGVSTFDKVNRK